MASVKVEKMADLTADNSVGQWDFLKAVLRDVEMVAHLVRLMAPKKVAHLVRLMAAK